MEDYNTFIINCSSNLRRIAGDEAGIASKYIWIAYM